MRCLPRHPPRLRLTQPCPWQHPAFAPPFGSTAPPVIRVISSVGTGLCVPAWSGRTLARAPKATFPASPLKFRTSGFPGSGFKRQAPPQEFGAVPSATSATLKADPAMPVATSRVCAALRLDSTTRHPGDIIGRHRALCPGMTCRLRHLSPEALAPDGLCCSAHHRLIGLIRQSGELRAISRTAVIGTVLDIQGSQHPVRSPHLPVFHC